MYCMSQNVIGLHYYFFNNSGRNQPISITFSVWHPDETWHQKNIMPHHLQTPAALPWQVKRHHTWWVICQIYSTMIWIKQLIFNQFSNINYFKTVNYGSLLPCATVSVQSDLILPELQQHLHHKWTAFQQEHSGFGLCTLNTGCNVGWSVTFFHIF